MREFLGDTIIIHRGPDKKWTLVEVEKLFRHFEIENGVTEENGTWPAKPKRWTPENLEGADTELPPRILAYLTSK